MPTPNANWNRWIVASAAKHIKAAATRFGISMFIEGADRQTDTKTEHIEFRVSGPFIRQLNNKEYELIIGVNVLFKVDLGTDVYRPYKVAGMLEEAMIDICVYRYGDGIADNDTLLGTMVLMQDIHHPVKTSHFGQINPDERIWQGTVEGAYMMNLSVGD